MRSKVPGIVVGILLILFVASSVKADFALGDWKFIKTLALPPEATAGQPVELLVDTDVFSNANIGLSDHRVIDDLRSETPYLIESLTGRDFRST